MRIVVALLTVALAGFSCAGLRVGPNSWVPTEATQVATPQVQTYHAVPVADATVHDSPEFAQESLGERDWLMVGRNDAHVWVTYLRFDLTSMAEARGAAQALLRLPPSDEGVMLRQAGAFVVNAYAVVGDWDEDTVTWRNQPSVGRVPVVRGATRLSAYDVDTFDVTEWVNELLAAGETQLDLALVPGPEVVDSRRQWRSREGDLGYTEDLTTMPRLEISAGPAPPRVRQAVRARLGR